MNIDQKLTAIRDMIQQDIGNRGLARDPERNLINAFPRDFESACLSIADHPKPKVGVVTGFMIPSVDPPMQETDGPLGSVFLWRAFSELGIQATIAVDDTASDCFSGLDDEVDGNLWSNIVVFWLPHSRIGKQFGKHHLGLPAFSKKDLASHEASFHSQDSLTHLIAIERAGPNHSLNSLRNHAATTEKEIASFSARVPEQMRDRCYTMRGRDITELMGWMHLNFENLKHPKAVTIGIGDGGNEIGMGKIPHETIVKNIPNGDLIHCRVATDHLIVAGVSNWGAYGLAAGVALLRGVELPEELFDPDRERAILQVMVENGPLVDGVTGQQTATVDGLSWDDYIKPLVEIGKIVRA